MPPAQNIHRTLFPLTVPPPLPSKPHPALIHNQPPLFISHVWTSPHENAYAGGGTFVEDRPSFYYPLDNNYTNNNPPNLPTSKNSLSYHFSGQQQATSAAATHSGWDPTEGEHLLLRRNEIISRLVEMRPASRVDESNMDEDLER